MQTYHNCKHNLENEKVMVHNDIYFHIESYEHLNWNHMKDEMESQLIDTIMGARNLDDSSLELCLLQS